MATLPAFELTANVGGLQIERDGSFSVRSLEVITPAEGIARRMGLADLLPFDITEVSIEFRQAGNRKNLANFDVEVAGNFNLGLLSDFPFDPVLAIGAEQENGKFRFSVRVVDGNIMPLNVGPITIGIANFDAGPATINEGTITLGGYQGGVFVPDFGGTINLTVGDFTGGIELAGIFSNGLLSVTGSITTSFAVEEIVEIEGARIDFRLGIEVGTGFALTLTEFAIDGAQVESVTVRVGDFVTFRAADAVFDFNAAPDQNFVSFVSLSATIGDDQLTGTVSNFAVRVSTNGNVQLVALSGFAVGIEADDGILETLGMPDWLPISITKLEITFGDAAGPGEVIVLDPLMAQITVSATVTDAFGIPLSGGVKDLTIDIGKLVRGEFPIVGLDGFFISLDPIPLGGLEISGTLALDTVDVDGRTELYAFVQGGIGLPGGIGFDIQVRFLPLPGRCCFM